MTKPQASLSSDADDVPEKVWLAPSVAEHYGCAASYEAPGMLVYVPESHLTTLRAELEEAKQKIERLEGELSADIELISCGGCAELEQQIEGLQSSLGSLRDANECNRKCLARVAELEQQIEEWREILQMVNECPFTVDPATVPTIGITEAPPYQVVVVISMAWTKLKLLREALAKWPRKE